MNIIDKLYTEWAWRTKSGVPSMSNTEDKKILQNIISELVDESDIIEKESVIKESDTNFDSFIQEKLGEIPKVHGSYQIPNSSTTIKVDSRDLEAYKKVHGLAIDQAMGYGELALYWLYQHQENGVNSQENRNAVDPDTGKALRDAADLKLGDAFVEVKAYGKGGEIKLGKFASDYRNLRILNSIFALDYLTKVFDFEKEKKVVVANDFKMDQLFDACRGVWKLKEINLDELADVYDVFKDLNNNFKNLMKYTDNPEEPLEMARMVMQSICLRKFGRKPGLGHFIAEAGRDGQIHWFRVSRQRIESEDLLKYVSVTGGEISVNYQKLFPDS